MAPVAYRRYSPFLLASSFVTVACTSSASISDVTCDSMESPVIDLSIERSAGSSRATIARVYDLQESARTAQSIVCRGKAEWSDGRSSAIRIESSEGTEGITVDYRDDSVVGGDEPRPEPVGEVPDAGPEVNTTDGGGTGDLPFDPEALDCDQIRKDVVAMSERDRISRGFGLLKIYEPELVSKTNDRLSCRGRAVWTNGRQTPLEYGFYQDSEGDFILTFKEVEADQMAGGTRG